ncbi:MAG: peptidase U62 [Phycisphaerales bacterium]|nr:MAG: peptidase U62 [Phycisphaerales bacterium]
MHKRLCTLILLVLGQGRAYAAEPPAPQVKPEPLLGILTEELEYAMKNLVSDDGHKPYYVAYAVYDERRVIVTASDGALANANDGRSRRLDVDVRVGDYKLDNTHQIRDQGAGRDFGGSSEALPLADDADAIRHVLWLETDARFKDAAQRLTRVEANLKVKVEEEDQSDDFSRETPSVYYEATGRVDVDLDEWGKRLRRISADSRAFPLIYQSSATLGALAGTRTMVTSEGTRLQTRETRYRITLQAATKADDGMDIFQSDDFNAADAAGLPDEAAIERAFRKVIEQVMALRSAPLAEPYTGPAILRNRASAVFFHEIFGHRIEGHRQKDVTEGQTFTKKIGQPVLPDFLSVYDDPTTAKLGGVDLRGFYRFDDEGVAAQRVGLIESGVLKTFLLSRSPVEGFPKSNGHGRREPGREVVSRQGNLIVESKKQVPFDQLRALLVDECRRQDKPYGLLFEDISGGFTTTRRGGPQAFKVLPIVVYRVYVDGRPDELIRGVDIVGTPLSCFERITHTGDDPAVFNGTCGAESGWVPVAAASPSILVSAIEIEKRQLDQSRPPILPSPYSLSRDDASTESSKNATQ